MKSILPIFLLCLSQIIVYGQTVRVYTINNNGTKGQLTRTETYKNNLLTELNQYEDNQLAFTTIKTYNAKQQLIKEVKTFKKGHEYDLIKEFDYDSKGRKIYTLFGNNRTGKWSSEGYSYNAKGDIDTIFFYQKNGELSNLRVFEYTYNSKGKKTKVTQKEIDLEMDEETISSTSLYGYNTPNFDVTISELDDKGNWIYKEWIKNNANGQPKTVEYQFPNSPKTKVIYQYNSNQKPNSVVEFTDNEQSMKTMYKYNRNGKLIEKKYATNNGYSGEIYEY